MDSSAMGKKSAALRKKSDPSYFTRTGKNVSSHMREKLGEEGFKKHLREIGEKGRRSRAAKSCLHDTCENCHGSEVGKFGACPHLISCKCPKCSYTL